MVVGEDVLVVRLPLEMGEGRGNLGAGGQSPGGDCVYKSELGELEWGQPIVL